MSAYKRHIRQSCDTILFLYLLIQELSPVLRRSYRGWRRIHLSCHWVLISFSFRQYGRQLKGLLLAHLATIFNSDQVSDDGHLMGIVDHIILFQLKRLYSKRYTRINSSVVRLSFLRHHLYDVPRDTEGV